MVQRITLQNKGVPKRGDESCMLKRSRSPNHFAHLRVPSHKTCDAHTHMKEAPVARLRVGQVLYESNTTKWPKGLSSPVLQMNQHHTKAESG